MGKEDKPTLEQLLNQLQNEDIDVRIKAAIALGDLGDSRTIEPLIKTLQRDEDWRVRLSVGKALASIDDIRAVDAFCALLQDRDAKVKEFAIESIRSSGIHLAYLFRTIFECETIYEDHWDWRGFDDYIFYLKKLREACDLPALIEMPETDEEMESAAKETAKINIEYSKI